MVRLNMPPVARQLVAALLLAASASGSASAAWLTPCATARLIASWKREGFWRTAAIVDSPKSLEGHRIRYVGKLGAGGRTYKIYYDDNSDPETQHGHQDIVVTTGRGRFLGFYEATDIHVEPSGIDGADILFNASKASGYSIHFGPKGPPRSLMLDGVLIEFAKPDETDLKRHERGPRLADYCRR